MMKNEVEGMPSEQQRQGTSAVVPSPPPPPHAAAVYIPSSNQQHLTPQQHLKPHQHVQPQQHLQPQQQQQAPSVEEQVIENRQALQLLMAKRQQHVHNEEKTLPLQEEECQRRGQLRRIEKQQRRGSGDEVQQWMKAQWQPQKKEQQRLRMEEAERQQAQQELVCRRICCDSRCKSVPLDSSSIRDSRNISDCDNDSLNCGRPTVGGARVVACRGLLTTRTAVQSFAAAGALPRTRHPELQQRRAAVSPCSHRSVVCSKRTPLPAAPTPRRQTAASNMRNNTYSPLRSACAAFSTERQASAEELPLREPLYRQQEQQHGQQQQQLERHMRPEKQQQKQPQQQTRRKRQQQQQNRRQQQQQRHGEQQQQQQDDSGRRTSRSFAAADLLNLPELCRPLLEEVMETGTSVDFCCESPDRSSGARDASCLSFSSSRSSFCVAVSSSSGAAITLPLSEPSFPSCSVCHSAFLSGSSYLEELAAPSRTACLPQCCLSMCNNTALPPASPRCARSSLHDRQSSGFLRSSFQCRTCLGLTSPSPYSLSCPSLPAATAGSANATCNSPTASRSASISLIATSASPHAQETSTPRSSLHSTLTPVSLRGSVAVAAETLPPPPAAAARIAFLPEASAADEAGDSSSTTTTTTAAAAALFGGGVHSKACSAVTRCTAGVSGATAVADFDVAADARAEGGRRCCTRPGEEYWEGEKVSLPSIARSSSSSNACCNRAQQEDLCGGYVTGGRGRNSQRDVCDPAPAGREPNTAAAGATAFRIAEAATYAAGSRRVSATAMCELAPSSGDAAAASSVFSAASGNVAARGEPIWDLCDAEGLSETTEEDSAAAQRDGCWCCCRSGSAGAFACVRLPVSPSKVANRLPLPHWLGTVLAGLVVLPLQLPLLLLQVLAGLLLQLLHSLIPPPLPPYFSWKVFRAFLGPGWLIAMAYLDPGNLEGDLQAGSHRRALAESSRASLDVSPTALAKALPSRFPPLPETASQHPDASTIPPAYVAAAAAAASAADTAGDAADTVQHSTLLLLALQRLWPQQQQHWKPVKQQLPPKDEEEESRYSLLWVLLWGHAAGGVFQILAARLGNTTGLDLATLCRRQLSRRMAAILWLLTELAVIGADVQAVLGCAVALKLLVNAPVWLGVLVTLVDCFTLLWFNGERTVQLENFFGACIGLMALAFLYTAAISRPAMSQVLQGLLLPTVPSISRGDALNVLGLLGGILMPHNVFLHSALVLTRNVSRSSPAAVAEANYYFSVETALALFVSLILNCSVLCAFASPLIYAPLETPLTFETAPKALETAFGRKAVYIWASGLLAAGQNAAIAGTYAGQFIMQGLLDLHFSRPVRLAVTRLVTIIPLAALAYVDQDVVDTICRLVNMSQAMLLPFTLIPLVGLNSCPQVMGMFRLCGWRLYTVWLLAGAVTAASALVALAQFVSLHPTPQLWVLFLLLASLYGALLAALHRHRQPDISCAYLLAQGTR